MDYRALGASGLNVPVIGLGTANFRTGAGTQGWLGEKAAARLIDMAIDHGAPFFDSGGTHGSAEDVLGKLLGKRRPRALVATRAGLRAGDGPNETGASRHHLIDTCERSLRRLATDYIDLFQIHAFDGRTPVEETLSTLDRLIAAGKVRYVGCSNHAAWQLMKALAASDRHGWARYVSHQIAWSLVQRDAEWELVPLGADQNVASLVWSPLAGGLLSGKYGRGRLALSAAGRKPGRQGDLSESRVFDTIDCLGEVAKETGATHAQVAIAWLLQRPTVASLFIGASSADQFEQNLGAIGLHLTGD
ncbi:MAG: aldo/keto reductase, partial [Novosphingobium sp.]